ncbi:MAG TPA: hypothetical protein PLB21_12670 [Actinomycetota bacterium]|nr:hypothetical protein [Actinomycetota bacterium]
MVTRRVVAVVGVAVLCLVGCTPTATETVSSTSPGTSPVATSTPTATPTTTPEWSGEQQAAVDAVEKWYRIYNEVMRRERDPNDLARAARGTALTDAQVTYNKFGMADLTVEGDITISELVPGELARKQRKLVLVEICEDMTKWSVLDSDGTDTLSLDSKVVRPLVITVEDWQKDGWFVTSTTGGEQSCAGSGS